MTLFPWKKKKLEEQRKQETLDLLRSINEGIKKLEDCVSEDTRYGTALSTRDKPIRY